MLASFLHLKGVNSLQKTHHKPWMGVTMSRAGLRAGWACGEEPRAMGQLSFQPGFGECQRELQQIWKLPSGDPPRLAVPHEMGHGKAAQATGDRSTEDKGRLGVPGNPSVAPTAEM